jgi:hypothetical protein
MPPVVKVAATVTPCRHKTGPTVLDERWHDGAQASAAGSSGDVVGTDQVSVSLELAVRAAELPILRFGSPLLAGRTSRGAAMFVHQADPDAGSFGLVAQRLQHVGASPLAQPKIMCTAGIAVCDPSDIADHHGAGASLDHEGDHLLGCLVVGLMDATAVTGFDPALLRSVSAPAARAWLSATGCSLRCFGLAGLSVAQV